MENKKIVYVCNFSSEEHRSKLRLKNWGFRNGIAGLFNKAPIKYRDYGPWNEEFFKCFESDINHEYYVLYPHTGVKGAYQTYVRNGITFFAINSDIMFLRRFIRRFGEKYVDQQYKPLRAVYRTLMSKINPDLLVICGIENPECLAAYNDEYPIYAMLQTFLNRKQNLSFSLGTDYTRKMEQKYVKKLKYIGCPLQEYYDAAHELNPNAVYFKISYPSMLPPLFKITNIEYDFAFFAGSVMKNKGIEDAIQALGLVCKKYPKTTLNIIGKCATDYRAVLDHIIEEKNLTDNIVFNDYFPLFKDVYRQVQKSKYVVLPSITAPFNTTVKESLHMGIPTIVYRTSVTSIVNRNGNCLIEANMEDISDLADKMLFAIENPLVVKEIGLNGKEYAKKNLTTEAIGSRLIESFSSIIGYTYKKEPIDTDLLYSFNQ